MKRRSLKQKILEQGTLKRNAGGAVQKIIFLRIVEKVQIILPIVIGVKINLQKSQHTGL